YYLTWKAREYGFHTTLIENSMVINDKQPEYCVERAMHLLNRHKKAINGAKILMLGIAYKNDIDDYRESPAIRVLKELKKVGAEVEYFDPWVPEFKNIYGVNGISITELTPEVVSKYDLIMITAAHHNIDYKMVQENAKIIFDTKNAMSKIENRENIEVL
ncbi:MAG: UDP-N-acetyl-D-glucosamine dehydrogenase, partial [Lachnospiraceae bacterium]|nr:UDP-N-acetyl-D-glucosamine dehydrogenase [Lachnospiraceae bacterium]